MNTRVMVDSRYSKFTFPYKIHLKLIWVVKGLNMRCTSVAANSYIVGNTKKKKMAAPMKEPGGYDAEEEAWLTGSHKSQHKFNFFDDSVTDDAHELVKQWKAQKDDDEDEADDIIEWDGTPSTPISYKKPSTAADAGFDSPLLSVKPPAARLPSNSAQTPTRAVTPASAGVNHKRSYSLTAASGKTGPGFSSEKIDVKPPSIAEVVSRSNPSQLEIEVSDLKRALQMMKRERWRQPSATETVRAIIQGEPYGLEMCKSKEQKLAFLDEAIKLHDGNAITAAVLFLQKSLKPALFNSELSRRPAAVNHYLSYLRAHFKIDQLEEVLGMLGRTEEAAMLKYKQAVAVKDPRSKIHQLQRCLSAHFCDPSMAAEASLVDEQISLLERQGPIEDSDVRAEREGRVLAFRENPRAASIINMPVVTTLYYCCFYHYDLPENNLASPAAIRKRHQLTDKQFLWTALNARARLKRWKDVEVLLTAKGWFGSTKMKSAIGFDRVAVLLHKAGATNDVLGKYLVLIEDVERRLALAKKLNCPEAVIDTYVALRDRAELEAYLKQLKPRSNEYHYAEDALRNSAHKWKT